MKKISFFFSLMLLFSLSAHAASVTGTIQFTGQAPQLKKVDMNADPTCSSLHPTPVMNEDVIVNANQTLKNVFVYVKEGLEGQTFETPEEPVVLDQQGCMYSPRILGLQVHQPLQIVNSDSTLHNVHGMPKQSRQFNLGMPIKGMKLKRKFDTPEVMVKFKCDVHPWMRAYVGVTSHPFFSVSSDDGTFEIKGLPAGSYVLEAWHEKFGRQIQSVTVGEEGITADFTYTG